MITATTREIAWAFSIAPNNLYNWRKKHNFPKKVSGSYGQTDYYDVEKVIGWFHSYYKDRPYFGKARTFEKLTAINRNLHVLRNKKKELAKYDGRLADAKVRLESNAEPVVHIGRSAEPYEGIAGPDLMPTGELVRVAGHATAKSFAKLLKKERKMHEKAIKRIDKLLTGLER